MRTDTRVSALNDNHTQCLSNDMFSMITFWQAEGQIFKLQILWRAYGIIY